MRCAPVLYLLRKTLRNSGAVFLLLNDNCAQTEKANTISQQPKKLVLDHRKVHVKKCEIKTLDTCLVAL